MLGTAGAGGGSVPGGYEPGGYVTAWAAGADGVRDAPTAADAVTLKVGFETSPQSVDFTQYGIDQAHGARLFCKLDDRALFLVGGSVTFLGDEYTVLSIGAPMQGGSLGHAQVILQRLSE